MYLMWDKTSLKRKISQLSFSILLTRFFPSIPTPLSIMEKPYGITSKYFIDQYNSFKIWIQGYQIKKYLSSLIMSEGTSF